MPRTLRVSEDQTRKEMKVPPLFGGIDPQLEEAGWYLRDHAEERAKVKIEIPVDGYNAEPWNGISDYRLYRENGEVLTRQFETYVTQHYYSADQIRFVRAVQSVFLENRHLETADTSASLSASLYEPPLDMFGTDAVERWFTEKEVEEVVEFTRLLTV